MFTLQCPVDLHYGSLNTTVILKRTDSNKFFFLMLSVRAIRFLLFDTLVTGY